MITARLAKLATRMAPRKTDENIHEGYVDLIYSLIVSEASGLGKKQLTFPMLYCEGDAIVNRVMSELRCAGYNVTNMKVVAFGEVLDVLFIHWED